MNYTWYTYKSWPLNGSRPSLVKQEEKHKSNKSIVIWPEWAVALLEDEDPKSLIISLENKVGKIMKSSKAIHPDGTVRLMPICNYLDVEVSYIPRGGTGIIFRENNKWKTHIYPKTIVAARETLAHELGHAIIYQKPNGGIYERAWNCGTTNNLEEALCNYAGRLILMPEKETREFMEKIKEKRRQKELAKAMQVTKTWARLRLVDLDIQRSKSS